MPPRPDDPLLAAISDSVPGSRRTRYLVGVSGGRDSVVLLHALASLGFRNLVVCHLDHGLRGEESKRDRAFVKRLAVRLGFECETEAMDLEAHALKRSLSLETAGREARLAFFAKVARLRRCPRVFLAHHRDDLAETFLFNLLRGAGPTGLATMRPRTELGELILLRPMLALSRSDIDRYAKQHRLRFREDASNADPRHTRNRLRNEVIPLLEEVLGRDVRRALARTAEILRSEEEWISDLPALRSDERLTVKVVAGLPLALQRRLLKAWLERGGIRDVGFDEIERVRSLLDGGTAKVNLPGARHARRRAGVLFLE
jgi:tRNA(Ile)-lysidine synthase